MKATGFFAYPSIPSISEVVKEAIKSINGSGVIEILSWEELQISGLTIINEICDKIQNTDIFLADLTYLNPNVLFELGYAIARNRKIIVFLDPSIEKSKNDFENLTFVSFLSS